MAAWPADALVGSYELLMMMITRGTVQAAGDAIPQTGRASEGMPDALQARAAEEFANDVMTCHTPSIRTICARLHVGQPRAQLRT